MTTNGDRPSTAAGFTRAARLALSMLGLVGVVLYLLLRSVYAMYYGSLGVAPAEVGLDYATTLANSAGLILVFGFVTVLVPCVLIVAAVAVRWLAHGSLRAKVSITEMATEIGPVAARALRLTLPAVILVGLAAVTGWYLYRASEFAEAAREGHPIEFGLLPLSSFTIRASAVRLQPITDDPGRILESIEIRSDQEPPLLYLGRASGTLVIYDSTRGSALHIPAATVIAELANCELGTQAPEACSESVSP